VNKIYDIDKFTDIDIEGIDHSDYPKYCDAFICSATYDGREATDDEIDWLNEQSEYVYDKVMEHIY